MAEGPPADELAKRLVGFLSDWLGAWPPRRPFDVASSPARELPGWDGRVRPFLGVETPAGTVVSLPAPLARDRRVGAAANLGELASALGGRLGEGRFVRGVFRWSHRLVELPALGQWVPPEDGCLPHWLAPFNGDVLCAFDDDGSFVSGVGLKRHGLGVEIAVGTEERGRGRGLAKRLVAEATRRIVDEGGVAIYLHAPSNHASAAVAEATGFPDEGWKVIDLDRRLARRREGEEEDER